MWSPVIFGHGQDDERPAGHADRSRPLLRGPGYLPRLHGGDPLARWKRDVPDVRQAGTALHRLAPYLAVRARTHQAPVLDQDRDDLRRLAAWDGEVAAGRVADREREERHQLLRAAPGA